MFSTILTKWCAATKTSTGQIDVFCLFAKMVCCKTSIGPVQVLYHFAKMVHRNKTSIGPLEVHHFAEMVCLHKSTLWHTKNILQSCQLVLSMPSTYPSAIVKAPGTNTNYSAPCSWSLRKRAWRRAGDVLQQQIIFHTDSKNNYQSNSTKWWLSPACPSEFHPHPTLHVATFCIILELSLSSGVLRVARHPISINWNWLPSMLGCHRPGCGCVYQDKNKNY